MQSNGSISNFMFGVGFGQYNLFFGWFWDVKLGWGQICLYRLIQKAHLNNKYIMMNFNQEEIKNFALIVNTFTGKAEFTFEKPNMFTLMTAINIWANRAVFGLDKKIDIFIKNPQAELEAVLKLFENCPSINLNIDGKEFKSNAFMHVDGNNYYEGSIKSMLILNLSTKSRYNGGVKSLTELVPHGSGMKAELVGTKDQVIYQGQFFEGKKQGFGVEERKYQKYEGSWEQNQKHGWGKQSIMRKKKVVQKQAELSEKSEKGKVEQDIQNEEEGQQEEIKQKQQDPRYFMKQKRSQHKKESEKKIEELSEEKKKELLKVYKSIYQGPFQKGSKSGEGGTEFTKYGTYTGSWVAGAKTGHGTMKYRGGAEYVGEWRNNIIEGKGTYTDEAKNVYEGEFESGTFDGQGTMKYVNGDVYAGSWSKGRKHGKGVYTYADGDYYDGDWVKDSAEGAGVLMANGLYYDGTFSKGMKHGIGEEQNFETGDLTKGIWRKNKLEETISINGELCSQSQQ